MEEDDCSRVVLAGPWLDNPDLADEDLEGESDGLEIECRS